MGNVLNSRGQFSPQTQGTAIAPTLLQNPIWLGNLATENKTFTPSLASNDAFLTNLQPNLRPKFTNDAEFQKWVQGFASTAITTAQTSANAYADSIKTSLTDSIKSAAAAAQQAAQQVANLYTDAAIKNYDPTALGYANNAAQQAITTSKNYIDQVNSASNKAMLDQVATVNLEIAKQAKAAQDAAVLAANNLISTYDTAIKKYITDQNFATKQYADSSRVQLDSWINSFNPAGITDVNNLSTNVSNTFSDLNKAPVFGGNVITPGLNVKGQSNWVLSEDTSGKLCLSINQQSIACINGNGDLVAPGTATPAAEQFGYRPKYMGMQQHSRLRAAPRYHY